MFSKITDFFRTPPVKKEVPPEPAAVRWVQENPGEKDKIRHDYEREHKPPADPLPTEDVTSFSVQAIRLLMEQDPPVVEEEEKAEILDLLSQLESRGVEEVPIALGQPIKQAIEAVLTG